MTKKKKKDFSTLCTTWLFFSLPRRNDILMLLCRTLGPKPVRFMSCKLCCRVCFFFFKSVDMLLRESFQYLHELKQCIDDTASRVCHAYNWWEGSCIARSFSFLFLFVKRYTYETFWAITFQTKDYWPGRRLCFDTSARFQETCIKKSMFV